MTSHRAPIFFIRHGESTANAGGAAMPHADIPLSELGLRQSEGLARSWSGIPTHAMCSGMTRALRTCEPLAKRFGLPIHVDGRLDELTCLDQEAVAGMGPKERADLARAWWERADLATPHGPHCESFEGFAGRVRSFKDGLPDLPGGSAVFGHGIWLAMLAWQLAGRPVDTPGAMRAFRRFQQAFAAPNCAVYAASRGADGEWSMGLASGIGSHAGPAPREASDAARAEVIA